MGKRKIAIQNPDTGEISYLMTGDGSVLYAKNSGLKILTDINMSGNAVDNIVISEVDGLPTTGKEGQITYYDGSFYCCNGKIWSKMSIVGEETIDEGEIFNDYENNKAVSKYSTSHGTNNIAGSKGFKITAFGGNTAKTYTLDSVEGLAVNDTFCLWLINNYDNCGKITNIDTTNNIVTVDNYVEEETTEDSTKVIGNILRVPTKLNLGTVDFGTGAFAEGYNNISAGVYSHSEGRNNVAIGKYSHVEGQSNTAVWNAHAEGRNNIADGQISHVEGTDNTAKNYVAHVEGRENKGLGDMVHVEGWSNEASGESSHAEGRNNIVEGKNAHAEGWTNKAYGESSHVEGYNNTITTEGAKGHAEGNSVTVSGAAGHAEGNNTTASGTYSHSEGNGTVASGTGAHAEGLGTKASVSYAHAEGNYTEAKGLYSHAEGELTIASGRGQHVQGKYNIEDSSGNYAHIVGNGTAWNKRKNIHTVDWNGNAWFAGKVMTGNTQEELATKSYVDSVAGDTSNTYYIDINEGISSDEWAEIMTIPNFSPSKTYIVNNRTYGGNQVWEILILNEEHNMRDEDDTALAIKHTTLKLTSEGKLLAKAGEYWGTVPKTVGLTMRLIIVDSSHVITSLA